MANIHEEERKKSNEDANSFPKESIISNIEKILAGISKQIQNANTKGSTDTHSKPVDKPTENSEFDFVKLKIDTKTFQSKVEPNPMASDESPNKEEDQKISKVIDKERVEDLESKINKTEGDFAKVIEERAPEVRAGLHSNISEVIQIEKHNEETKAVDASNLKTTRKKNLASIPKNIKNSRHTTYEIKIENRDLFEESKSSSYDKISFVDN